jgi:hypothetical protein
LLVIPTKKNFPKSFQNAPNRLDIFLPDLAQSKNERKQTVTNGWRGGKACGHDPQAIQPMGKAFAERSGRCSRLALLLPRGY